MGVSSKSPAGLSEGSEAVTGDGYDGAILIVSSMAVGQVVGC